MALFYVGDFSEEARKRLAADCDNGFGPAERIAELARRPAGEGERIRNGRLRADIYMSRLAAEAVLNDTPWPVHAFADTRYCQSGMLFSVPRPLCVVMPSRLAFGPGLPVDGVLGEGLMLSGPLTVPGGRRLDDAYFLSRLDALETAVAQIGPHPLNKGEVAAWAPAFYTPEGAAQRAPYYVSIVSTQDDKLAKEYWMAVRAGPMGAARDYLCFLGGGAAYVDDPDAFGVLATDDSETLCALGTAMRLRMVAVVAAALDLDVPKRYFDTPCNLLTLPRGSEGPLVYHHGTIDTGRDASFLYDYGPVGPVLRYRRANKEREKNNNAFAYHVPASACRFSEIGGPAPETAVPESVVWPGKSAGATSAWANPSFSPAKISLSEADYDIKLVETYSFVCALVCAEEGATPAPIGADSADRSEAAMGRRAAAAPPNTAEANENDSRRTETRTAPRPPTRHTARTPAHL